MTAIGPFTMRLSTEPLTMSCRQRSHRGLGVSAIFLLPQGWIQKFEPGILVTSDSWRDPTASFWYSRDFCVKNNFRLQNGHDTSSSLLYSALRYLLLQIRHQ